MEQKHTQTKRKQEKETLSKTLKLARRKEIFFFLYKYINMNDYIIDFVDFMLANRHTYIVYTDRYSHILLIPTKRRQGKQKKWMKMSSERRPHE